MVPVRVNRDLDLGSYPVMEVFPGLEDSPGLRRLLPGKEERRSFLAGTHVEVVDEEWYMYTDDGDGHVNVGLKYLRTGEDVYLYLDILHELVHVRQFKEGKELFDTRHEYVDRPTEVEAYQFVVEEARRMGLGDDKIYDYLKVEWVTKRQLDRLAQVLGVRVGGAKSK